MRTVQMFPPFSDELMARIDKAQDVIIETNAMRVMLEPYLIMPLACLEAGPEASHSREQHFKEEHTCTFCSQKLNDHELFQGLICKEWQGILPHTQMLCINVVLCDKCINDFNTEPMPAEYEIVLPSEQQ